MARGPAYFGRWMQALGGRRRPSDDASIWLHGDWSLRFHAAVTRMHQNCLQPGREQCNAAGHDSGIHGRWKWGHVVCCPKHGGVGSRHDYSSIILQVGVHDVIVKRDILREIGRRKGVGSMGDIRKHGCGGKSHRALKRSGWWCRNAYRVIGTRHILFIDGLKRVSLFAQCARLSNLRSDHLRGARQEVTTIIVS